MIPAELDISAMLADLKTWGWNDYKIEVACDYSKGYVSQVRNRFITFMSYQRAARLYNLWESERDLQTQQVQVIEHQHLPNHLTSVTT